MALEILLKLQNNHGCRRSPKGSILTDGKATIYSFRAHAIVLTVADVRLGVCGDEMERLVAIDRLHPKNHILVASLNASPLHVNDFELDTALDYSEHRAGRVGTHFHHTGRLTPATHRHVTRPW